ERLPPGSRARLRSAGRRFNVERVAGAACAVSDAPPSLARINTRPRAHDRPIPSRIMGPIRFLLIAAVASGCASIERGFEPNPIVAAAEGRWHVNATTFNYVTGERARNEWDLTMAAISPDTLSFEIFENSRRSQWGEQTYSLEQNGSVHVAE